MSGGSYDYLCYKDGMEINSHREQLAQMRDRLTELGYKDAAKETESVILLLEAFEVRLKARLERLQKVWQAVEWCDSGDCGKEDVEEAINNYRGESASG